MKFKSLFRKKETSLPVEQKGCPTDKGIRQVALQANSLLGMAVGYGTGFYNGSVSDYEAMQLYRQSSAVATAVDIIAQEIENINPVVRLKDGSVDDSHDILDLLMDPNDFNESYTDFIGDYARNWLLTHNAFVYAAGNVSRPPLEIYSVKPQNVTEGEDTNDVYPMSFNVSRGQPTGNYTRFLKPKVGYRYYDGNLKEVWQTRGYSSRAVNTRGDSPLLPICLEIYQQIKGRIHNVSLLDNGARPSMLVTFKDETITQEDFDYRVDKFNKQMKGVANSGKPIFTAADDIAVNEMGQSNRDMDYLNMDVNARNTIFSRYNVPLPLVDNSASTFNNLGSSVEHLYDFAVLPNVQKIFMSLTMFLAPRYGLSPRDVQITYNMDDIEALQDRMLNQLKLRREMNLETVNELREYMPNREPLDGQDVFYQASTLVPAGEDLLANDNRSVEERATELENRDNE